MPSPFLTHPGQVRWWITNASAALAEMLAQTCTVKARQSFASPRAFVANYLFTFWKIIPLFIEIRKMYFENLAYFHFFLLKQVFSIDSTEVCCSCYGHGISWDRRNIYSKFWSYSDSWIFSPWKLTRAVAAFLCPRQLKKEMSQYGWTLLILLLCYNGHLWCHLVPLWISWYMCAHMCVCLWKYHWTIPFMA